MFVTCHYDHNYSANDSIIEVMTQLNESTELSGLTSDMSVVSIESDSPQPQTDKFNWKIQEAERMLRCVPIGESLNTIVNMLGITWLVDFYPRGLLRGKESTKPSVIDKYSSITITAMCAIDSVGPTTTQADYDKTIGTTLGKFCLALEMDGWNTVLTMNENNPLLAVVGYRTCLYQFVPSTELKKCSDNDDNFSITLSMKSI